MLFIEKLETSLSSLGLGRPLADTDVVPDAVLPRVIVACSQLRDVADQMKDYVGEQLTPRDSGIMKAMLRHGCRFMGNAMAACWHDPEGNSQPVVEYLVLTFVEVLMFSGMVPTATLWIQAGLESGICWYISVQHKIIQIQTLMSRPRLCGVLRQLQGGDVPSRHAIINWLSSVVGAAEFLDSAIQDPNPSEQ